MRQVTLEELEALISQGVSENEKLRILIRSDKNVRYKVNEELMAVCAKAGAYDMIFSAFDN